MTEKICSICGEARAAETDFYTYGRRDGSRGLMAKCKTCHLAVAKRWNQANPERVRENRRTRQRHLGRLGLAKNYGVNPIDIAVMEAASQGHCCICGEYVGEKLMIDHDHETGNVRGLLCRRCNTGLGMFRDQPKLLFRAIRYLVMSRP